MGIFGKKTVKTNDKDNANELYQRIEEVTPEDAYGKEVCLHDSGNRRHGIAFGLCRGGVPRKMLAAQIYSESELPVSESLVSEEGKIPSGAAVSL